MPAAAKAWVAANGQIMNSQEELESRNKTLSKVIEDYVASVTSMFNAINTKSDQSREEQLQIQRDNLEASKQFTVNLKTLMEKGLDQAIVQQWAEMGERGIQQVELWKDATYEEIEEMNRLAAESTMQGTGDIIDILKTSAVPQTMAGVYSDGLAQSEAMKADFFALGGHLMDGAGDGISNNTYKVTDAIDDMTDAMGDRYTGNIEMGSPSRLYARFSKSIPDGVAQGIAQNTPTATSSIAKMITAMNTESDKGVKALVDSSEKAFREIPQKTYAAIEPTKARLTSWGSEIDAIGKTQATGLVTNLTAITQTTPEKIKTSIAGAVPVIAAWGAQMGTTANQQMASMSTGIQNTLKPMPNNLSTIGGNTIQGFWNGMNNKQNWLMNQISGFFGGVVSNIKGFFGIKSPSTLFAEIGENVDLGFVKGFWVQRASLRAR